MQMVAYPNNKNVPSDIIYIKLCTRFSEIAIINLTFMLKNHKNKCIKSFCTLQNLLSSKEMVTSL